jgi:hypothetical protein
MLDGLAKVPSLQKQDLPMPSLSANVTCNINAIATL